MNVQLGFVNNTVLGLATAALGFAVSRESCGWRECVLLIGIAVLVASVAMALWCAVNRLQDFRETAQLARGKMGLEERIERRRKNQNRSDRTWTLLYLQLATFGIGALLVVIAVAF